MCSELTRVLNLPTPTCNGRNQENLEVPSVSPALKTSYQDQTLQMNHRKEKLTFESMLRSRWSVDQLLPFPPLLHIYPWGQGLVLFSLALSPQPSSPSLSILSLEHSHTIMENTRVDSSHQWAILSKALFFSLSFNSMNSSLTTQWLPFCFN